MWCCGGKYGLAFVAGGAVALAVVGSGLVGGTAVRAQPEGDEDEMAAMMAAWEAISQPGEYHAKLEPFIGTWDATAKFWMDPSGEPTELTGVMTNSWVLGGRFVREQFSDPDGPWGPFEGLGFWGYDNAKHEYVSVWMDTTSTAIMATRGTCDAAGKVFTATGAMFDPMVGQDVMQKHVVRMITKDKFVMEFYVLDATGQQQRMGEITYTRRN